VGLEVAREAAVVQELAEGELAAAGAAVGCGAARVASGLAGQQLAGGAVEPRDVGQQRSAR